MDFSEMETVDGNERHVAQKQEPQRALPSTGRSCSCFKAENLTMRPMFSLQISPRLVKPSGGWVGMWVCWGKQMRTARMKGGGEDLQPVFLGVRTHGQDADVTVSSAA